MHDQKTWNAITKNLFNEDSIEEKAELLIWMNENEVNKTLFFKIKLIWENANQEDSPQTFLAQFTKAKFKRLIIGQALGNFIGFAIAFSATRFFSHQIIERRSVNNLFGLMGRKQTVVNSIPEWLQWVLSVLIGFIVFEFINYFIQTKKHVIVLNYIKKHLELLKKV